jgi:lysine 6-dehydrogenase
MSKVFAVLGAGMQGTAAAYDLAKFGSAAKIKMGDVSLEQANKGAWRVNDLVGSAICSPFQVNAMKPTNLAEFPYWMHPEIAKVAIETKTNMVDLGGNTEVTMETLAMDELAKSAGVSLVPDTGLAPGLVNSIGMYLIENMESCDSVKLYCGVLPQNPKPPFNYKLTFNVEGLLTEYDYQAVALRDGEICLIDTLTELEDLTIDELGPMEAFVTSGGTSTAPYTLQGRVTNYEYKTIRFPGHCERIKIFKDFGFWNENEIEVDGKPIIPRHLFYKVFGEALEKFVDDDLCAIRGVGVGKKDGKACRIQVDIFDKQCKRTGFTSMERLTGFSCAIFALEIANGGTPAGCLRYENAMTGTKFLAELQRRQDISVKFS